MPLTQEGQNAAATGVGDAYSYLSIHTADPTGGNEVTGGSYARIQVTWNAATGGLRTASGSPVAAFSIPAGNTCTHWGLYDSLTVGTLGAHDALPASEAFGSDGTLNVNSLTLDPLAS